MANTNLNFNIKINNKELDLTKTSFKEFSNVIKQAKTELSSLPLNDPRYKVLTADIKSAENAWKEAKKGASDFNDEMEDGGGKVDTYKKQIKEATDELLKIEKELGKSSEAYKNQAQVIADLREQQEELIRGTQQLDDTLSNIPGPIGQIASSFKAVEDVGKNVNTAFRQLGISFKTTDGIIKASGIGALVLLLATLVAAIVNAAKKSEALQAAFAAFGDAIGAIMDALKPVADFFIKIFVVAINAVADAMTGLASVFGGVNRGFKQQSIALEKELEFQKSALEGFNQTLSSNLQERLKIQQDYLTKKKEIIDKEYKDELQRNRDLLLLEIDNKNRLNALDLKYKTDKAKNAADLLKLTNETGKAKTDNERKNAMADLGVQGLMNQFELAIERKQNKLKIDELQRNATILKKANIANRDELLALNQQSLKEALELQVYYLDKEKETVELSNEAKSKLLRQYSREDRRLINERANEVLQLTTSLIKEENARNLQGAKDALVILKEQHRTELEDAKLAGVTLKGLKDKQRAEEKAAKEKVRLEQVQYDAYLIQLEIDKQNRLATEVGQGTQEYFDARREIIQKELQQELLLADGNEAMIEEARTKHWKALLDLDKEGVNAQIDMLNIEYSTLFEGTTQFYEKQRELEKKNYELAQLEAQGNYDKLEALRKQHERNMELIDNNELQARIDMEQRKADATLMIFGGFFDKQREVEEMRYKLRLKQAGDNVQAIEAIEKEHQRFMRESRLAEIQLMLDFGVKLSEVASGILNAITAVNDARMAKELKAAEGNAKAQEEIKKKYFEKNKKAQIAQAYIATFQAAVQAYSAMAGIPVVGPALGAIAAAAAIVAGLANVSKIKATSYDGGAEGSGSGSDAEGSKPALPNYLRNYEDGGMIGGRRHAEGGTLIEAEKGEAIMTRGAVTMFAPMLSMMNQMGGGAPFAPSLMTTSFDKPNVSKPAEEQSPIIVKSYVVSSDMTKEQEKQARLKDLSTL